MAVCDSAEYQHQPYPPFRHPRLAEAVFTLDAWLRRRQGVVEYSRQPSCLFRVDLTHSPHAVVLPDGERVDAGRRIARLHFWNEHVPPIPAGGATIRWARQLHNRIELSLGELARYLSLRLEFDDVAAICGNVPAGDAGQEPQIARIMGRFGFVTVADPTPSSMLERLHRLGENILISMIVFVLNGDPLGATSFGRSRVPIFISRRALDQRFGDAAKPQREVAMVP